MKLNIGLILLVLTFGLFLPEKTVAQLRIPRSILATGGMELTSSANIIVGTVGQPLIGVAGGSAHILNGGFWYAQANAMIVHITPPRTDVGNQPKEYALYNNYPNPFNPATTLEYTLMSPGEVSLIIYNLLGQEITTLVSEVQQAGYHKVVWDAANMASGVYLYRLRAGDFVQTRKMLLLK